MSLGSTVCSEWLWVLSPCLDWWTTIPTRKSKHIVSDPLHVAHHSNPWSVLHTACPTTYTMICSRWNPWICFTIHHFCILCICKECTAKLWGHSVRHSLQYIQMLLQATYYYLQVVICVPWTCSGIMQIMWSSLTKPSHLPQPKASAESERPQIRRWNKFENDPSYYTSCNNLN